MLYGGVCVLDHCVNNSLCYILLFTVITPLLLRIIEFPTGATFQVSGIVTFRYWSI